jgi:type IV secretion system protein TrbB
MENIEKEAIISKDLTRNRVNDIFVSSMEPVIMKYLADDDVTDIMVNPDGKIWVERFSNGRSDTGHILPVQNVERIIRIVATMTGVVCNGDNPTLAADLPDFCARFQGMFPPIVPKPIFAIRKKALRIFSIDDYVTQGVMSQSIALRLKDAVKNKENILIVGGTASGKTTLANAIIADIALRNERIVSIEDTQELQFTAEDYIPLCTKNGNDMRDLVKNSLRLRPDRIIIGEVRGGAEALEMLKAWNTGHPGGLCTVQANGLLEGLVRLEQLMQEVVQNVPRHLIAETVNLLVFIEKIGLNRRIQRIAEVEGCSESGEYILRPIT